jgi:hypothetical protein
MIDTGKVKTVCREETDERTTSSSVQREKRRIARQKERRATLILGKHCYTVLCALSPYSLPIPLSLLSFTLPPPPTSAIPPQKIFTPLPPPPTYSLSNNTSRRLSFFKFSQYTVKKRLAIFPLFQPGCYLANSPWPGIIKNILGWGRENR